MDDTDLLLWRKKLTNTSRVVKMPPCSLSPQNCIVTTKRKKIRKIQEEEINNKLKQRSQSNPTRNSKFTKRNHTKNKKRLKTANWFLHLDNLSSELAFNFC